MLKKPGSYFQSPMPSVLSTNTLDFPCGFTFNVNLLNWVFCFIFNVNLLNLRSLFGNFLS